MLFGFILVVQLLKTKTKSLEPRKKNSANLIEIDIENRDSLKKSMLEQYEDSKHKDQKINIRIKPRTKDHPSDDFKVVVWY